MKDRYRLGRLGNGQLLAALKVLVQQESELTADLLAHLAELDQRRLYLDLGFPSLFAYCTESLRLSESSAGRRITAARVGRRFPEVFAAVARGDLNLSILCALNPYLRQENAAELFGVCSGKKRHQVEELLAARFPRPDVRDAIRRLPVRAAAVATAVGTSVAREATAAAVSTGSIGSVTPGTVECGAVLRDFLAPVAPGTPTADSTGIAPVAPSSPAAPALPAEPLTKRTRVEPLSVDRYGVHFTADGEFRDLLQAARALGSHRVPSGNIAEILKLALRAFILDAEQRRFALGRKPRATGTSVESPRAEKPSHSPGECDRDACVRQHVDAQAAFGSQRGAQRSRHVPAAVAREVYVRDEKRCSFVSADGRRCDSRAFLELDHAEPWAVGGAATRGICECCAMRTISGMPSAALGRLPWLRRWRESARKVTRARFAVERRGRAVENEGDSVRPCAAKAGARPVEPVRYCASPPRCPRSAARRSISAALPALCGAALLAPSLASPPPRPRCGASPSSCQRSAASTDEPAPHRAARRALPSRIGAPLPARCCASVWPPAARGAGRLSGARARAAERARPVGMRRPAPGGPLKEARGDARR